MNPNANPQNPNLVTGRVGELVDYAHVTTFKVVRAIFGYGGPYRKVLHRFGIGDLKNTSDYLLLINGRIFSDIEIEAKVLWQPCSYKLVKNGNRVIHKFHYYGLLSLSNFLKKNIKEILCFVLIDHYLEEADTSYRRFSEGVEAAFKKGTLHLREFLDLYEEVVFTSYLYELYFNYNNQKEFISKSESLKAYIKENDCLLLQDNRYVEFVYKLPKDFELGVQVDPPKLSADLIFIPDKLPIFNGKDKKEVCAEARLQCIKNNMRAKINVLLYLLNRSLNLEA